MRGKESVLIDKDTILQVLFKIRDATANAERCGCSRRGNVLHSLYKAQSFLHDAFPYEWLNNLEIAREMESSP